MNHRTYISILCLLLVSCAQELSQRTIIELRRERDGPVGADGIRIPNNPKREAEFKIFWTDFRKEVLSKNWYALSRHISFPLKTRGSLDSDPVIEVKEEEFQRVFAAFLRGEDPSHFGASEETLIQELRSPNPYIIDDWIKIGDMQFEYKNDEWKLYWIYFDVAAMPKRIDGEQSAPRRR